MTSSIKSTLIPEPHTGLTRYLSEVKKFPMLSAEEELELATKMHENKSIEAAHKLITSHLRLVVSVALKFKGYGLPVMDLIAEGNIGLMKAVKKFDLTKGYRLSTYALWWIRASIQDYILRSWSLVKIGTTSAQKKLFFSLNKVKRKLAIYDSGDISDDNVKLISDSLNVPDYEVIDMNRRMIGNDSSLNLPATLHSEGSTVERQDLIADETPNQELVIAENDEEIYRKKILAQALMEMPKRDREIIIARRMKAPAVTLETLSQKYDVSRERIRQIEDRAFKTLKQKILTLSNPKIQQQITHDKSSS